MYALRLTKASTAAACSSSSWERSAGGGEGGLAPSGRSAHMRSSSRRLCTESGGGAPGVRIRRCRGPEERGARGAGGEGREAAVWRAAAAALAATAAATWLGLG